MTIDLIKAEFLESRKVLDDFISNPEQIEKIREGAQMMSDAIKNGGKIISAGNGGSHCDAMHFAEELTGRYRENRKSLPAIAISDPSHISCVGNDFGFDHIFSRFIEGMGNEKDVFFGLTTSGNSTNIINAVQAARSRKMKSIILTGKDGGKIKNQADLTIIVPHFGYADRIQEVHIKIIHIFMLLIESEVTE